MNRICPLLVATLVLACGREADNAGGAVPPDTVVAELLTRIGEVDGPAEYMFGDVSSVAVGQAGIVFVADRLGSTVRAYDFSGRHVRTIGSEGQGPGEFVFPNDVTLDATGRLYVRDAMRLSVFGSAADHLAPDSLIRTVALGGRSQPWSARGRIVGSSYYYPNYLFRNGEILRYFYQVYDSVGATGDTVQVPPLENLRYLSRASYPLNADIAPNLNGLNRAPFEARATWDMTSNGSILSSSGDRTDVVEWAGSNDTVRVIRLRDAPRPVPPSEFRDSARAFQARIDSLPVPLDRVRGMSDAARNRRLPHVLPAVLALHVDADGNIWLRRWPGGRGRNQTVFDVLDRSGTALRTVVLPDALRLDPPPFVSSLVVAGVVTDARTSVQRIAVYRIPSGKVADTRALTKQH